MEGSKILLPLDGGGRVGVSERFAFKVRSDCLSLIFGAAGMPLPKTNNDFPGSRYLSFHTIWNEFNPFGRSGTSCSFLL
jgi:hypothetical protein